MPAYSAIRIGCVLVQADSLYRHSLSSFYVFLHLFTFFYFLFFLFFYFYFIFLFYFFIFFVEVYKFGLGKLVRQRMSTEQGRVGLVMPDFDICVDDHLYLQLRKSQESHSQISISEQAQISIFEQDQIPILEQEARIQISIMEQLLEERERVLNEHIQKLDKMIHQQANIMAEQKATITIQANIMFEQEMQAIVKDNTILVQANIMFEQETQAIVKDNTIQVQQEALQRCFSWRQSTFHQLPSTIAKKGQ